MKLEGIRALVVGMEKSGQASAAFLRAHGADVTTTDIKPLTCCPWLPAAERRAVRGKLGSDRVVSRRPGRSEPLQHARARGVDVIGEVELAAHFLRGPIDRDYRFQRQDDHHGAGRPHSAIGRSARAGGRKYRNARDRDDRNFARRSMERARTFQLPARDGADLSRHIGVCLNVTQNHLDRHHTMENYIRAKGNLFRMQLPGSYAVLNAGDAVCRRSPR
jgi:UDP-N-acetylmuramoylalanine--D-glutamate ligase